MKDRTRKAWRSGRHPSRKRAFRILHDLRSPRCRFLRLPVALRSRIYDLVWPEGQPVDLESFRQDFWFLGPPALPSLLQLEHPISDEARPTYLQNSQFYMDLRLSLTDVERFRMAILGLEGALGSLDCKVDIYFRWDHKTVSLDAVLEWAALFAWFSNKLPKQESLRYHCLGHTPKAAANLLAVLRNLEIFGRSMSTTMPKIREPDHEEKHMGDRVVHHLQAMLQDETSDLRKLANEDLTIAIKRWQPRVPCPQEGTGPHWFEEEPTRVIPCPWCLARAPVLEYSGLANQVLHPSGRPDQSLLTMDDDGDRVDSVSPPFLPLAQVAHTDPGSSHSQLLASFHDADAALQDEVWEDVVSLSDDIDRRAHEVGTSDLNRITV